MQKCLRLNLLRSTRVKRKQIRETYQTFLAMIHSALPVANGVSSRKELHDQTYYPLKAKYPTASQLIIEATSYTWEGYFRCKRCHYEAHRDRVASLNLAKRANLLFAQEIQSSPLGSVAVNQRAWEDDEDLTKSTVSQTIPRSSKPPILIGGH